VERRGTVVGSGNNVAPEMLENEESSYATDIWQLGIVIYMMHTGKTPFTGAAGTEMMLSGIINFPKNFPHHAENLVKKLLQIKPEERLGAGSGEDSNYDALRAH